MSQLHGGFFVQSVDAKVAEPIRLALSRELRARRIDAERHRLTFAARRGCPVMHVAVRGPSADGKDYAYFHQQHADLGAIVARAAGVPVWAYHYENQVGSESVRSFGPDGTERGATACSWDELFDALGDSADEDERSERMYAAAPLGVLAAQLGVSRRVLEMDLAYDTPCVSAELVGRACTRDVAAYLAQPLLSAEAAPRPEVNSEQLDARQSLYFPIWMAEELEAIARRFEVTVGTVAWAAWEAAKVELHRTTPIVDAHGEVTAPPCYRAPPLAVPPAGITVPREAPKATKPMPAPTGGRDKILLTLALPSRVLEEVQAFAVETDRSLSWTVQKAFTTVRDRLHAASRPT